MKIIFIIFGLFIIYITFVGIGVYRKIHISQGMVKSAKPYQRTSDDVTRSLLVLGDSTAVGVGADTPEDSAPALYAEHIQATLVENRAISGAKIADVLEQVKGINREKYSEILLQIGANDIVALKSAKAAEQELRTLLLSLPTHEKLTVLICGNVGSATLIPWFLRPLYTKRTVEYHNLYGKIVPEFGGIYINLYTPKILEAFENEPHKYLAEDAFHPSSVGYRLWYDEIVSE